MGLSAHSSVQARSSFAKYVLLMLTAAATHLQARSQDPSVAASLKPAVSLEPSEKPPTANPARPTVTNPAHIPPPGYLQFEQGLVEAADSSGSPSVNQQFSLVQTTKLALNHYVMIQASDQPFASTHFQSAGSRDTGDLLLGAQLLLTDEDEGYSKKPTIAFGFNRRVRTGTSADLDTGSFSQGALALMSGSVHGVHYDTNVVFNEQHGQNAAGADVRRAQFGQSLALTRQLNQTFVISAELWHFTQPLVSTARNGMAVARANAVGLLVAGGYTVRPNLVFDVAVDHGLTSTSTAWEGIAGFTYLLPHRLWSGGRR